jgi:hypothetical protein
VHTVSSFCRPSMIKMAVQSVYTLDISYVVTRNGKREGQKVKTKALNQTVVPTVAKI